MTLESLMPFNDVPWVVLDWGVVRSLGKKARPPGGLVTVLPDIFIREAATASGNYPGIKVANAALASLPSPHPVVCAQEWHSFDVDESVPPAPLRPHQVIDVDCTRALRSSLLAGRDAFLTDTGELPTGNTKEHWQRFVDKLRPRLTEDEDIQAVRNMTRNILAEPHALIDFYGKALPQQVDLAWRDAIADQPNGYPKFLFFGAILFYVAEFVAKGRTVVKAIENDFDDIHYLVPAGVTGHLCTAERSAGRGVAHLPDAAQHLFGSRVNLWTPQDWENGARPAQRSE